VPEHEIRLRPPPRRSRDRRPQAVELAHACEPVQDARIYIEKINGPFLFELKGTPAEYKAGLDLAIAKGWLELHESGTYVKVTEAGAAMFA
jgi:hypothetical protein